MNKNYIIKIIDDNNGIIYHGNIKSLKRNTFDDRNIGIVEIKRITENDDIEVTETLMVIYNNEVFRKENYRGIKPYVFVLNDKRTYDYSNACYIEGLSADKMKNLVPKRGGKAL